MEDDRERRSRSQLFTIQMWAEVVGDQVEHRGRVRHVVSGAFRNFREWSDLTSFLSERMEEAHLTDGVKSPTKRREI
jgi:hypothetical protein